MTQIPDDVRARVRAKASSDWPDDYEMQKHTLEKQFEAYIELESFRSKFATDEFITSVLSFAAANWPDDYEIELHTFKKQLDAGIAFFEFKAPDVPSDVF